MRTALRKDDGFELKSFRARFFISASLLVQIRTSLVLEGCIVLGWLLFVFLRTPLFGRNEDRTSEKWVAASVVLISFVFSLMVIGESSVRNSSSRWFQSAASGFHAENWRFFASGGGPNTPYCFAPLIYLFIYLNLAKRILLAKCHVVK
jgi:hypothetical protein